MMKKSKYGVLTLVILLTGSMSFAQTDFPSLALGPAAGWETGEIAEHSLAGPAVQLRLFKMFQSYPFTLIGADLRYAKLEVDNNGDDLPVRRLAAGVLLGAMLPLDMFGIKKSNIPEGAGPPFYLGYNFLDKVEFIDNEFDLTGTGVKAGFQLPAGPYAILQFEYSKSTFDNSEETTIFKSKADETKLETWTFYLQIPLSITKM